MEILRILEIGYPIYQNLWKMSSLKCIEVDRNKRFSSMANVIADITNIRLKDKTVNLPTANLTELAETSDKVSSWEPKKRTAAQSQVCLAFCRYRADPQPGRRP